VTDREAAAIARAVAKVADTLERAGMLDAAGDADLAFCATFGEDMGHPLLAEAKFQVLREVRREGCTSRPAVSRVGIQLEVRRMQCRRRARCPPPPTPPDSRASESSAMAVDVGQLVCGALGGAIASSVLTPLIAQRGERRALRANVLHRFGDVERAGSRLATSRQGTSAVLLWRCAQRGLPRERIGS
jgi:hypothetical protein